MSGAGRRRTVSHRDESGILGLARWTHRWLEISRRDIRDFLPSALVTPAMGGAVSAGLLVGAVIAIDLAWIHAYGLPELLVRGAIGMFTCAVLAALVAARWAASAPRPAPAPARDDLWDLWLDAEAVVAAEPGITFIAEESEPPFQPRRAAVRPRVIVPESGESMRLEDEILPFARRGERGAIRISGPFGSGKTTALAHLAAALPRELAVCVLDEPPPRLLDEAVARGIVVYAAGVAPHPVHLASFDLAPWGEDEVIEYLLATARGAGASVMRRLQAAPDRHWINGNPALMRIVLDRMAGDPALATVHEALRQELAALVASDDLLQLAGAICLVRLRNAVAEPVRAEPREAELASRCRDPALRRLFRQRPIQLLLAAGSIVNDLVRNGPCDCLETRLPYDLVRETGSLLRADPLAQKPLRFFLNSLRRDVHPMAASLLHAAGIGWEPPVDAVCPPNLAGAYLNGVAWSRVDLRAVEFEGADLSHANLEGARLDAANLDRARLGQASLVGASLKSATARGADLSHANLASIRAQALELLHANLEAANLTDAFLHDAKLVGSNLKQARLCGADLIRAKLCSAELAGADFTGAILDSAMLMGLTLCRSVFTNARFTAADLSGCDLEGMELPQAVFRKAQLRDALLTGSTMPGADFRDACLHSAGLAEIDWEGASLAGADLREATFHLGTTRSGRVGSPIACEGSRTGFYTDDFEDQDFKPPEEIRKANLRGADLRGARIDDVDFYLVDLRGAVFDGLQAEHFRRCGAILTRA